MDDTLLLAGFLLRDWPGGTKARGKALRDAAGFLVTAHDLEAIVQRAIQVRRREAESLAAAKRQVVQAYRDSGDYKADLAELLRPSIEQTFAQIHDYRQLVSLIIQHVNVFLETRFPRLTLDEQLDKVNKNIRSIYWSARMMEFKLSSALFLAYPERITDPRNKRVFRLHGAIHKYLQIYKPLLDARGLHVRVVGDSRGNLMENPDAIGVIPQAFLDNAIKYAPAGSEVVIEFQEDDDRICLSVRSEGPRIHSDEAASIFDLFHRGREAKASGEEGTGFGLGLAHLIAEAVGAALTMEQDPIPVAGGTFLTTFSASFLKPIEGEGPPSIVNARPRQRGGPSTS